MGRGALERLQSSRLVVGKGLYIVYIVVNTCQSLIVRKARGQQRVVIKYNRRGEIHFKVVHPHNPRRPVSRRDPAFFRPPPESSQQQAARLLHLHSSHQDTKI